MSASTEDEALRRVHPIAATFAAWMAGSAAGGVAALQAAVAPAKPDLHAQLVAVFQVFESRRYTQKKDLDGMLRSDPTAVLDLEHPMIRGDVRRLHVLQHELQRACLTATLLNLPIGQRASFVLTAILGFTFEEAATIMGTSAGAVETANGRARRGLDSYLGPRCEHISPHNPCRCAARLGVALDRRFIDWPERGDLNGDAPVVTTAPPGGREPADLFAALPSPLPLPPSDQPPT